MISLDTETNGLDMVCGAKPYLVTTCNEEGVIKFWEWDVNPLTREPIIPVSDLREVRSLVEDRLTDRLVLQNSKFDCAALKTIIPDLEWPWDATDDTLIMGHLLHSGQRHDLTSMALMWLGIDIEPFEIRLKGCVMGARRIVQQARLKVKRSKADALDNELALWRIAEEGLPEMPSAKGGSKKTEKGAESESPWKFDAWLPRAMATRLGYPTYPAYMCKIISGGQTGIDQAALKSARSVGLETGGWVPLGWRTQDGIASWLKDYGLWEVDTINYADRTAKNVADSDATLQVFEDKNSPGEICTIKAANRIGRPMMSIDLRRPLDPKTVADWIESKKVKTLNVAGNSERTCPGIGDRASKFLIEVFKLSKIHPWRTACRDYANADSGVTLPLFMAQMVECRGKGLEKIYRERMKLPQIAHGIESRGITYCPRRASELNLEFAIERDKNKSACLDIAAKFGHELELPKGASPNGSLRTFIFDVLKVEPIYNGKAKTDAPTLNKEAMTIYEQTLDGDAGAFIKALVAGRKYDTQLAYIANYERFAVPCGPVRRLHQSANPTGTDHLRWSFANPNMSNISKQEIVKGGRTLRYLFGPAPGREWWSFDYENIELRIPAYESGEQAMIDLFERPDDGPFFGSYHLLNASIIYPDLFWEIAKEQGVFKDRYKSTWYQWCKNAGFALIYGCGEETFDRTARRKGSYGLLRDRLPKLFALADRWIVFANKHGYIETLPDRTVDLTRGYPVECSRSEWGKISPTIPMNYHTSGTAMQCTNKGMARCDDAMRTWSKAEGKDYFTTAQVHDELLADFPAGGRKNLPKVKAIKMLMEESGRDIGIPLKVSISWHPNNWGDAEDWKAKSYA